MVVCRIILTVWDSTKKKIWLGGVVLYQSRPVAVEDLPAAAEPAEELRRVKRRKGRRNLANFENLPMSTHVYELSEAEPACPCCGLTRKKMGADESFLVEYLPGHFERIQHVRKKYACL